MFRFTAIALVLICSACMSGYESSLAVHEDSLVEESVPTTGSVLWKSVHDEDIRVGYMRGQDANGRYFHDKPIVFANRQGNAIFEGDILLGQTGDIEAGSADTGKREAHPEEPSIGPNGIIIIGDRYRWVQAIVPFQFDGSFSATQRSRIEGAMDDIEAISGIRFITRSNQGDYVFITDNEDGCFAHVGRIGGRQTVNLGNGCVTTGIITHELLHAIGFWHEHSRSDRSTFVTIFSQNIESGQESNFDQHISDGTDIGSYDYRSVMHYDTHAFSKNGQPTIAATDPNITTLGGDRMTSGDIATVRSMYGHFPGTNLSVQPDFCYGLNTLSWSAISGATSYRVEAQYGNSWFTMRTVQGTEALIDIDSTRTVSVIGCNARGECSARSNTALARRYSNCF